MAKTVKVIKRKNSKIRRQRALEVAATPESFQRNEDGSAVVTVHLATERPVLRHEPLFVDGQFYDQDNEILLMSGLNQERIKGKRGIPFLDAHQSGKAADVLGRSVAGSLKIGEGEATIDMRIGRANPKIIDSVEDGTLADTSV